MILILLAEFILEHDRLVCGVLVGLMFFTGAYGLMRGRG